MPGCDTPSELGWGFAGDSDTRRAWRVRRRPVLGRWLAGSGPEVVFAVAALVDPAGDDIEVEAEKSAPFDVGDLSFGDESADVADVDAEVVGDGGDVDQANHVRGRRDGGSVGGRLGHRCLLGRDARTVERPDVADVVRGARRGPAGCLAAPFVSVLSYPATADPSPEIGEAHFPIGRGDAGRVVELTYPPRCCAERASNSRVYRRPRVAADGGVRVVAAAE